MSLIDKLADSAERFKAIEKELEFCSTASAVATCIDATGTVLTEGEKYPFQVVDDEFVRVLAGGELHEVFAERFEIKKVLK